MNNVQSGNKRKILTNIAWLLTEHGVRLFLGVFSTSILARALGVEGFGMFNYVLALTVMFQALSFINSAELMVPKLANASEDERHELVSNGFFIRLFFSVVAYLSLSLILVIFEGGTEFKLALILGLIILFGEAFGIVTAFLQSQTIIKYRSRLVMVADLVRALVLIVLFQLKIENINLYAMAYVTSNLILAIGLTFIYHYLNRELFFKFSFVNSQKLLLEGLPFFFGIVFMVAFGRLGVIAVRYLSDETTLGLYSSALQLYAQASVVAPIIATSFAPLLVYKQNQNNIIKKNVFVLSVIMFVLGTVTAILLYFFAPILISFIFGERFSGAIHTFQLLLFVLPFFFLNEGLNVYLIKMKLAQWMIYKWLIALLGAALFYYLFIPTYDATGAVLGYGFGSLLACGLGVGVVLFYRSK